MRAPIRYIGDMQSTTLKKFSFGDRDLLLHVGPNVFQPNLTTRMLADIVDIPPGSRVLDLGCGVGPIALLAAQKGAREVYAVDIMEEACRLARMNVELNGLSDRVTVLSGDLFAKLKGKKFDVIINDVSGMAETVSRISPWYPPSIPTGGPDGTAPTLAMLDQSRDHLAEGGRLYFPVLSLAKSWKILDHARALFQQHLEMVASKWVPFCEEFKAHMSDMEAMREEGVIDYIMRRSRHLWNLEIYRVTA